MRVPRFQQMLPNSYRSLMRGATRPCASIIHKHGAHQRAADHGVGGPWTGITDLANKPGSRPPVRRARRARRARPDCNWLAMSATPRIRMRTIGLLTHRCGFACSGLRSGECQGSSRKLTVEFEQTAAGLSEPSGKPNMRAHCQHLQLDHSQAASFGCLCMPVLPSTSTMRAWQARAMCMYPAFRAMRLRDARHAIDGLRQCAPHARQRRLFYKLTKCLDHNQLLRAACAYHEGESLFVF
jgi:hypothetical protein